MSAKPSQHRSLKIIATLWVLSAGLLHTPDAEARRFGGIGRGLRAASVAARTYGRTSAGGYVMNAQELKACLVMEAKLDPIDGDLQRSQARIEREEAALESLRTELERADATLDGWSAYAVSEFNRKVDDFNNRIAQLKIAIDKWNGQLTAAQADFKQFDEQCGGRWYYESDKQTVQASLAN